MRSHAARVPAHPSLATLAATVAFALLALSPVLGVAAASTAAGAGAPAPAHAAVPVDASGASAPAVATSSAAPQVGDGFPSANVSVVVQVESDGDARWRVVARYDLEDENETAAFRRLRAEYVEGADVGFTADTFRDLATRAADRAGREMSIENATRSGNLTGPPANATGTLSLSFQWTNFAVVDGDRIHVGDAFGAWHLARDQSLVLRPPPNYGITEFDPPPAGSESGVLRWDGARSFDDGEPSVTYLRGGGTGVDDGPVLFGDPLVFGGAVVGALLVGALVAYALAGRRPLDTGGDESDTSGDGPSPDATATAADEAGAAAADANDDTSPAPDESGEESAPGSGDGAAEEGIDPSLLSDEERVERLLRRNGGRMKQADIVSETGWSNAKVSQLLSGMDEEGRVEKLRIGRENLISLPGRGIDDGDDQ